MALQSDGFALPKVTEAWARFGYPPIYPIYGGKALTCEAVGTFLHALSLLQQHVLTSAAGVEVGDWKELPCSLNAQGFLETRCGLIVFNTYCCY